MSIDHLKPQSGKARRNPKGRQSFVLAAIIMLALVVWRMYPALVNLVIPEAERLLRVGDQYLAENRLPEAVLAYRQAVAVDGSHQEALRSLANAYRSQGRERMASRIQTRVDPDSPDSERRSIAMPAAIAGVLEPRWIVAPFEGTPTGGAVSDDQLVVAYEEGVIAALHVQSGELAWISQFQQPITSSPATDRDLVLIGLADGTLQALDLRDGAQRWSFDTGGPIYSPATCDEANVFIASSDGTLYAVDRINGELLWKFSTPGALHGTPEAAEGILYFGSLDGKIYAVESGTGAPVWKDGIPTSGPVEAQPLFYQDRLITGSGDGRVYSMDPSSGGQYWRVSTPDAIFTRPLAMDNVLYIASSGRKLIALDFESGKRIWEANFPVPLRNPPALTEKILFQAGDGDASLYIIDRKNGRLIGEAQTGDWIFAGPWIRNGMLFLLGKDGAGMAFELVE